MASKPTPLPRGIMLALSAMYLTNSLAVTILLPFAAFMVASFHVTDDPRKLGYYAGYLASSFFVGSLLSSFFWGVLSDRVGRRPVLLFGLCSNCACALLFGFSTSFRMAMAARLLNGLLSGIVPVAKTALSEISDSSNQAAGFSVIGVNWGIGLLLGPAIGGFLCEPADKYPALFARGSLFDRFPFALPCLVLAGLTLLGLGVSVAFVPETLGRARPAAAPSVASSSSSPPLELQLAGFQKGNKGGALGEGEGEGEGNRLEGEEEEEGKDWGKDGEAMRPLLVDVGGKGGGGRGAMDGAMGPSSGANGGVELEPLTGPGELGSGYPPASPPPPPPPPPPPTPPQVGSVVPPEAAAAAAASGGAGAPASHPAAASGGADSAGVRFVSSLELGSSTPVLRAGHSPHPADDREGGNERAQQAQEQEQQQEQREAEGMRGGQRLPDVAKGEAHRGNAARLLLGAFDWLRGLLPGRYRYGQTYQRIWAAEDATCHNENGGCNKWASSGIFGRGRGSGKGNSMVNDRESEDVWEGEEGQVRSKEEWEGSKTDSCLHAAEGDGRRLEREREREGQQEGEETARKGGMVEQADEGMWRAIFCERDVLVMLLTYGLLGFVFTAFDELFPLWCLTGREHGGLQFGTNSVGLAQTAGGLALVPFQFFVYPRLVSRCGPLRTLQLGLALSLLLAGFPTLRHISTSGSVLQAALMGGMMIRSVGSLCSFTSIFILLTNSVRLPRYLGATNGVSQTGAGIMRAIAPTVAGSLYAWSISDAHAFPLNYHFAFLLLGVQLLAILALTLMLPPSIDKRKFST